MAGSSMPYKTDLVGYRADGGGLGQDQGITPQLKRILTSKLPLLNAPGSVVENSLYYDTDSSSVTAAEMQNFFAKDRIAANTPVIGANPTFYIPSVLFTGAIYWVTQFNDIIYPATLTNNLQYVQPEGYGFWSINQIVVYMGAANVSQLQIDGFTNFMIAMACCETDEKRDTVLWGAGIPCTNITGFNGDGGMNIMAPLAPPPATLFSVASSGNFFSASTNTAWANLRTAATPIRVPWTSLVALDKRLSLDTRLLTQPIQLVLQTKPLNQIVLYGTDWQNVPQSYNFSTIQGWQQELSDKSLSVRSELLAMPEFNVALPAQMPQSIPFLVPTQFDPNTQRYTMNITSLINSDLTTMLFTVTSSARQTPGNNFCPLYGEILENFELLLNGQRFFFFDECIYNTVQMPNMMTTTQPKFTVFTSAGTAASNKTYCFRGNIYELNFGRLRSIIAEAHMQNTSRFTNQTFQMNFRINTVINWGTIAAASRNNFTLQMCYLYNSVYLIGGDGGTTKLITN